MGSIRADLHCHSTHSDGSLTPHELLELAKKVGLTGLAITDHDSISAFESIEKELVNYKLDVITGVELSTTLETTFENSSTDTQVHVLGYAFDPKNVAIQKFCANCRKNRIERNREILQLLSKRKMLIEESDIGDISQDWAAFGRPHIALAMMKKGYVKSIQEAFRRYIGEGMPCYIPGVKYSVQEAIDTIHEARGKAVIAHPHLIGSAPVIEALLQMNFDGLEAYYGVFDEKTNNRWAKIAEEKKWLATGGSDFHGIMKSKIHLGSQVAPEPVFVALWQHFQQIYSRP